MEKLTYSRSYILDIIFEGSTVILTEVKNNNRVDIDVKYLDW